jgi:peptide/nickel transport system substrate-binding protein
LIDRPPPSRNHHQEDNHVSTTRRSAKFAALVVGLSLIAAACGSDDDGDSSTEISTVDSASAETSPPDTEPVTTEATETPDTTAPAESEVPEGGTLVIGAEQEPDCVDWISTCAGSSWGFWMMGASTMPRAFDTIKDGDDWVPVASNLLTGEPELVTDPKQVVTYSINPDAVWSDGEPITSSDFKYTWDQIVTGADIYDTTGYADIESVDDSDPATAVVTFSKPYAGWKGLFGSGFGIYPSHILEGQDRTAMMASGYDFSGGPWIIDSWNKTVDVTLVPNPNYWGEQPKLDSIVFRFVPDTAAEFQAFKSGEVDMIYPQPQIDVVEAINAGIDGSSAFTDQTGNFESLWLNNSAFPFDSVAVRQALAYSLDRQAIVEALFGGLGLTDPLQTLNAPILSFFSDTEAFAGYTLDLAKVDELMTGDGWAKNGDGIWEKDGKTATFTLTTTAGNARRALTQQVVQEQAGEAGFEVTLENIPAGDFFGQRLPAGEYQAGLYAQVLTFVDPGLCNIFCSKNIPSDANGNVGNNWTRTNIPELDPLLEEVDTSLDQDARAAANKAAEAILAEQAASIPLDPLPNILLWSDVVVGPVADNPVLGPFSNSNEWGVAS